MKLDVSAKSPAEAPGDILVLERYAGEERLSPEVRECLRLTTTNAS